MKPITSGRSSSLHGVPVKGVRLALEQSRVQQPGNYYDCHNSYVYNYHKFSNHNHNHNHNHDNTQ